MKAKLTNNGLILFAESDEDNEFLKEKFHFGMHLRGKYMEGKGKQKLQLLMVNDTIGWIKTTTRKARWEKKTKKP